MAKIKLVKLNCAHCGKESEQTTVYSSSSFGSMDLDTRPPMSDMTLQYELQECPHCHFCNNTIADATNIPESFSPEYDALSNDNVISKAAKKYLLAAMLRAQIGDKLKAGEYYLKAAWVFDDENAQGYATDARKLAATHFRKHVDATDDGDVAIMLVDVLRRAGDFNAAADLINLIGDTEDDLLNNVLAFEKSLISKNDTSCHNMGEIAE